MSTPDTRERVLDTAERLFSENGFAATSLRSITAEAGVNLAAVNYHFGSKEALVKEVFARRIRPLNQERIGLLDAAEGEAGGDPVPLERILEALVGPGLRMARDPERRAVVMRLLGRTYTEPSDDLRGILVEQFGEMKERFGAALRRTLPHLGREDFFWRLHFVIGAIAQTMADPQRLRMLSDGICDPYDVEETVTQLVQFLAAGLRAPVAAPKAGGRR